MPEHMLAKTSHSMKQTNVEKFKCMFKYMIIKSGITCPMFISNALTLIQIVLRHILLKFIWVYECIHVTKNSNVIASYVVNYS